MADATLDDNTTRPPAAIGGRPVGAGEPGRRNGPTCSSRMRDRRTTWCSTNSASGEERHLDVACGSGLAASIAARRGASVDGLDAAAALIDIARTRTPRATSGSATCSISRSRTRFDVVTSFNGIWNRCEAALREVRRCSPTDGSR